MIALNDPATATNSSTLAMPRVMSIEVSSVRRPKRRRLRAAIFRMLSMQSRCPFRVGGRRLLADTAVLQDEGDFGLGHDLGVVGREHERRAELVAHALHQLDDAVRRVV